ncbi:MAG: hypothetical protein AAGB23_12865 [Pseudomonadota bacterium]
MASPQRDETAKKSQLDKFKKAARELDCDDDEARFKDRLSELVSKPKQKAD